MILHIKAWKYIVFVCEGFDGNALKLFTVKL